MSNESKLLTVPLADAVASGGCGNEIQPIEA